MSKAIAGANALHGFKSLFARLGALKRSPPPATGNLPALAPTPPIAPQTTPPVDFEDMRAPMLIGYGIIVFFLGVFAIWAFMAPIDEGVPASGMVAVESMRKVVSHSTGGAVATVHVNENQFVNAGDTLITLSAKKQRIAFESMMQEYIAALAKLARLRAEQISEDAIVYPNELLQYVEELSRHDILLAQENLFRTRKQALENEEAILRSTLSGSHTQAAGMRQQLGTKMQQANSLRQEIQSVRPLVDEGYAARNQLNEKERQLAELSNVATDLQTRVSRESNTSAEIRLRLLQSKQQFLRDVETQIADAQREVTQLRTRVTDARTDLENMIVRAPVSGQVIALQTQTIGSFVGPGAKILEIVPDQEKLLIDLHIPVNIISSVKPGLHTELRVSAFSDDHSLVIDGQLLSVASDRIEAPPPGQPYYLARVEVTPNGLAQLHGRQLRQGMPIDAMIKTGERSFINYLLKPILKGYQTALREK
ncbi:MAG TPA: HlyD family type I secretion periplasmic adaptor subunit [Rhodocyclaceae bacterium]|nr:HlyD family type I secretion periplasmic adaptor subunit [Rhodocyclaceae bacterium]